LQRGSIEHGARQTWRIYNNLCQERRTALCMHTVSRMARRARLSWVTGSARLGRGEDIYLLVSRSLTAVKIRAIRNVRQAPCRSNGP